MIIGKEKFVSVTYELKLSEDGVVMEKATNETPLSYIVGVGQMLPKFEENIEGLKVGDTFDFKVDVADAYGPKSEEAVVELPKNIFEVEGKFDEEVIKVGNIVPMQDASGNKMHGHVLEILEEVVKMDFNHPLAGNDLYFKGEIIEVRETTDEERKELEDCGCGCGCDEEGEKEEKCDDGGCGCGC